MEFSEVKETFRRHGLRLPAMLTLSITGACNLTCRHCWVDAGGSGPAPSAPAAPLRRLLEEFAALGGDGVRFTGGEPLCHPEWLGLMRFARTLGFPKLILQTNAMLFSDESAAALRELDFPGLTIQVSLDGATAAGHDLVRGEGAFDCVLSGLRKLGRGGLAGRVSLFFTEMRHNLEDFPALLELAADLGVASVASGTLVRGGRAAEDPLLAPPDTDQYLRLLRRFSEEPRFRELYGKIGTMAALEWLKGDAPRTECCTFAENPYLTPDGRLFPCLMCHADDFAVSGVLEKGLLAALAEGAPLWTSLSRISRSRASSIPECRDCPEAPACAGGCMGRALGSCGDLMAADDRCELRRAIGRQRRQGRSNRA